jgi:hypothetical protein
MVRLDKGSTCIHILSNRGTTKKIAGLGRSGGERGCESLSDFFMCESLDRGRSNGRQDCIPSLPGTSGGYRGVEQKTCIALLEGVTIIRMKHRLRMCSNLDPRLR